MTDASSPWLSVAVGDGEIQVSGQVSAGATVHFEVTVPVGMDEWLGLFGDGMPWDYEVADVPTWEPPHFGYFGAGMAFTPYWFVLLDDEVIVIQQQYIP